MQREITAIVLCVLAQAAVAAECVPAAVTPQAQQAQATTTAQTAPVIKQGARAANGAATQNPGRPGGELIKTAAAGTRDDAPPSARDTVSARAAGDDEDHPRRGGTAMLLAALALMSGIALRRYGNTNT